MLILSQEEINTLYKNLTVADKISTIMADGDIELYTSLTTNNIIKIVGTLGSSKMYEPFFDNDLFKSELTEGLNLCLQNEAIVEVYGKLWMAEGTRLVEILEAIAIAMAKSLDQYQTETKQAREN